MVYHVPRMNKDMIQNIFIGVLLGGVILLAGGVYYLAMQVQTATQGIQRIEESVTESMQKSDAAMMKADESVQKADAAMMKAEENAMTQEDVGPGWDTFHSIGLTFSHPVSWSFQGNADPQTSEISPGSFFENGVMVASLACPDEYTPSPDFETNVTSVEHAYVKDGVSRTAALRYAVTSRPDQAGYWWNTIEFGDMKDCSLIFADHEQPSDEERSFYQSLLQTIR